MNQNEINESKWLEIGLELIKIDLKSCKLKNMKLVEIHGSLFFKMEDFLGVIENDLIKTTLGKRLTEYINGQLEKLIEERARNWLFMLLFYRIHQITDIYSWKIMFQCTLRSFSYK